MGTHILTKVWMRVTNFPQNFRGKINCALNRKPYFTFKHFMNGNIKEEIKVTISEEKLRSRRGAVVLPQRRAFYPIS